MRYYPIQIPYSLDNVFLENINYKEEIIADFSDFIVCYWQMLPLKSEEILLNNTIILDGCIDLIADFTNKVIGFSGISKSNFHLPMMSSNQFMGLRLMPSSFQQLTQISAQKATDHFLPLSDIYSNFDNDYFFTLSFTEAKHFLVDFVKNKFGGLKPNPYVQLFSSLPDSPPATVSQLCDFSNLSRSQCQRNFLKNYGLSPKVVLSILRFQKSISSLMLSKINPSESTEIVQYYDQSHFINDFKRNIGLTPLQLFKKYKND